MYVQRLLGDSEKKSHWLNCGFSYIFRAHFAPLHNVLQNQMLKSPKNVFRRMPRQRHTAKFTKWTVSLHIFVDIFPWNRVLLEVFTNFQQYENANITNFTLAVLLEMD